MKIAFLSFYSGDIYRGVETFVHELANRLIGLGNEVVVYQRGKRLPGAKYKTVIIPIKIDYSRKGSYFPFVNYYALRVKDFTKKSLEKMGKDVDIVFPTNGQWQSVLCKLWAKKNDKKIVISGQSGPGLDDRINIYTFPDVFVGLTKYQLSWARRINPCVTSFEIPNGVDLNKFKPDGEKLEFNLPRPIILCVGAFDKWKRQDHAIYAVSKLAKGSLLLVGKGREEKNLKKLGDKLLPGRFRIMSFPHSRMPEVYRSCDLFTFPTVSWESFGIVLVEAMASGLGVIATDDPIRAQIVGEAGILVDPTNVEEYANALAAGLNKSWKKLSREQAEKYSWDDVAKMNNRLFLSLKK